MLFNVSRQNLDQLCLICRVEAVLVASQRYAARATPLPQTDPSQGSPVAPNLSPSSSMHSVPDSSLGSQSKSNAAFMQSGADSAALGLGGFGSGRSSLRWHPDVENRQYSNSGSSPSTQSRLGNMANSELQQPMHESPLQLPGSSEASPMASGPSSQWGRSSLAVQQEAASSGMSQAPGVSQGVHVVSAGSWGTNAMQKAALGSSAVGRSTVLSLLDSPNSFSSSFSSPYGMKPISVASSQSRSKPSSPTKRSHGYRAEQPLRTSSGSLPGNASLDAGSWIYIMGNRSSSIAAKQMARNSSNGQLQV